MTIDVVYIGLIKLDGKEADRRAVIQVRGEKRCCDLIELNKLAQQFPKNKDLKRGLRDYKAWKKELPLLEAPCQLIYGLNGEPQVQIVIDYQEFL